LAYAGRDGQWTLDTPINERAGAGGLYTSIPDLLKWDENFYTGKVGGAEVLKKIQTPGTLNNGTVLEYAWGLQIGDYRGLPIVEHSGSLGGYRAHIIRFPSQHASVALLCNASAIAPTALARRVADLVLGDRFTAPVPAAGGGVVGSIARRVPDAKTANENLGYAGVYYSDEVDANFAISAHGDDLRLQRDTDPAPILLERVGVTDEFAARGLTLRFKRDANRTVTGLTVDAGRVRDIKFTKR
jgi:hypothetical protein